MKRKKKYQYPPYADSLTRKAYVKLTKIASFVLEKCTDITPMDIVMVLLLIDVV